MSDSNNLNVKSRTLKLAKMALMVAISVICTFVHFPILPAAPFLEFEVSDIPILISGFVFGPLPGLVIGVVSILLRALILSPPSGPYGMIMHIIAISVFVLVSSAIYHKLKTRKWGILALVIGGLCMTAAMIPANLLITPHFMGVPQEAVIEMILPILLPFNLLKMAINTAVVFLLYKRLSPFLHKWEK
jgi:Predicted membrane protein